MFKNYMKIALKVLMRRKFFTFISLFGIAFTLLVLNVATSFYEREFSQDKTDVQMDKVVLTHFLHQWKEDRNHRNGWMSIPFIKKYFTEMESPEYYTIFSRRESIVGFVDGKKHVLSRRFSDENYWNMFKFNFLEGKPFMKEDLDNGAKVVVINKHVSDEFFPDGNPLNQSFTIEGESFRVVGVVDNISENKSYTYADTWIPYSSLNENLNTDNYYDDYHVAFMAKKVADIPLIKEEFQAIVKTVPVTEPESFDMVTIPLDTRMEYWVRSNYGSYLESGYTSFYLTAIGLLFAFLLLPTLNLVNINVSRIMERSSEIGVRKSFGASSKTLVYQFIIENIILTLIGGILAFILSFFILNQITAMSIVKFESYSINGTVFLVGLALAIFFGFLSGVLPAYKMSRLNPVDALKGNVK